MKIFLQLIFNKKNYIFNISLDTVLDVNNFYKNKPGVSMNNQTNDTINKYQILNWLYSTDRHVSIEKLGAWLENNTDGQYKLIKTSNDARALLDNQLNKEYA